MFSFLSPQSKNRKAIKKALSQYSKIVNEINKVIVNDNVPKAIVPIIRLLEQDLEIQSMVIAKSIEEMLAHSIEKQSSANHEWFKGIRDNGFDSVIEYFPADKSIIDLLIDFGFTTVRPPLEVGKKDFNELKYREIARDINTIIYYLTISQVYSDKKVYNDKINAIIKSNEEKYCLHTLPYWNDNSFKNMVNDIISNSTNHQNVSGIWDDDMREVFDLYMNRTYYIRNVNPLTNHRKFSKTEHLNFLYTK